MPPGGRFGLLAQTSGARSPTGSDPALDPILRKSIVPSTKAALGGLQASILLVDDRPANILALEAVLKPLGHTLVPAYSGEEALRHLLETEFALILMDVQMPGLDGYQTVALIKQREKC